MVPGRALAVVAAAFGAALASASAAAAAGSVTVSQTTGLNPAGQSIRVTGTGFDVDQGIYVAVCVDNGPGELPTPCIGGVDTTGQAESSAWISSNPPSYGKGLVTPYGPGGSFDVTLFVVGGDPKTGIDCAAVVCSVVTRADHTATDDRSQDTRTPLSFTAGSSASAAPATGAPQPSAIRQADTSTTSPAGSSAQRANGGNGRGWVPLAVLLVAVVAVGAPVLLQVRQRLRRKDPTA